MELKPVSVIVPTFRRPEKLKAAVASLLALDYPPELLELIVVDDADDPGTEGVLEPFRGGSVAVRLRSQRGLGAAAARNAGAQAASGEIMLFLDDDFLVAPGHLRAHVETHQRFGDALVGGMWQYTPDVLRRLQTTSFGRFRLALESGFRAERDEPHLGDGCVEATTLSACDLTIEREAFWSLGGFDERFPYAGTEDQDLCLRAVAAGHRLIRNLAIQPLHDESWLTLEQFCQRERRGMHSLVVLTDKHPQALGAFVRHEPVRLDDPPPLVVQKLLKSFASGRQQLALLKVLIRAAERAGVGDRVLWPMYRRTIGLHLFRGYREAIAGRGTGGEEASAEFEVTIAIVLYNSSEDLPACLRSIKPPIQAGWAEVIAVDNASPDDSAEVLLQELPQERVRLLSLAENRGFATGVNAAFSKARGRYWLMLNPDVTVPEDGLNRLVAWMDDHPQVGAASPGIVDPDGRSVDPGQAMPSIWRSMLELSRLHRLLPRGLRGRMLRGSYWSGGDQIGVGWVPGTAMMVRPEAARQAGPLRDDLFMYGEDIEWCARLRRAGWKIGVCTGVSFVHAASSSVRRTFGEDDTERRIIAGIDAANGIIHGRRRARAIAAALALAQLLEAAGPGHSPDRRSDVLRSAGIWWEMVRRG